MTITPERRPGVAHEPWAGGMHQSFDRPWAMMPAGGRDSRGIAADTVKAMLDWETRAERIVPLRGLLGRLCAPDLTLAGARPVRTRLVDLLEQIDRDKVPFGTSSRSPRPRPSTGARDRSPESGRRSPPYVGPAD